MSIGRLPRVRPLSRMKALIVEIATPVCALVRNDTMHAKQGGTTSIQSSLLCKGDFIFVKIL